MTSLLLLMALAADPLETVEIHLKFNEHDVVHQSWRAKLKEIPPNVHVHKTYGEMSYRINSGSWVDFPPETIPHPLFWNRFFDYLEQDYTHEYRMEKWREYQMELYWRAYMEFFDVVEKAVQKRVKDATVTWINNGEVHLYSSEYPEETLNLSELNYIAPPAYAEKPPPSPPPPNPLEYMLIYK